LTKLLARNKLAATEVDAVELLGGGSRIPRLQAALSEALEGRSLDRHLDADEAIVLGAGLFAANLSTSFRLRKFGMTDAAIYGVSFISEDLEPPSTAAAAEEDGGEVGKILVLAAYWSLILGSQISTPDPQMFWSYLLLQFKLTNLSMVRLWMDYMFTLLGRSCCKVPYQSCMGTTARTRSAIRVLFKMSTALYDQASMLQFLHLTL
jgi:hypothetical protein